MILRYWRFDTKTPKVIIINFAFYAVCNLFELIEKMIIEAAKIQNSGKSFDLKFESSEIDLNSEFANVSGETLFKGKISNSDLRTIVEGEIKTEVELNCNRCLRIIPKKIEFSFKNAYILAENYTEEEESELENKDLEISIFEGDKIDLSEVAGEQIALALPSQILCEIDCKGLCEKCGANRNLTNCKCIENDVDPRWAALENLIKK